MLLLRFDKLTNGVMTNRRRLIPMPGYIVLPYFHREAIPTRLTRMTASTPCWITLSHLSLEAKLGLCGLRASAFTKNHLFNTRL